MGVKGLWKLIESAGVPVPLETLEHKVLGVDVSIWLHQAVRGFRGPGGAAVANAHLLTLFHRICKLLFYRIRPVFVFDGGVPHLKKQTLASRKLRREVATNKAKQVRERLYKNLLKSQAVRSALGKSGPGPSSVHVPQVTKREKDLFELPPLPEPMGEGTTEDLEEEKGNNILQCDNLPNLHHFDFDSEEFKNLPLEAKHEILTELQDTRKQNSWANINDMPQQSENFADFQMARLMKRAKFQATLDSTRDEIQKAKVSEMETELFGNIEKYMSLSKRIISEDASHAIFIKKVKEPSKSDSETVDAESQESVKKMDRKGKAPLKRKKPIDKDFLTELAKTGIIRPGKQDSDSDSDFENDNFHLLQSDDEQDVSEKWQQCTSEDENFLQVVGSLMENSGLTQEEILALIKQDQSENPNVSCKNEIHDGPSTSANAPGSIFNPDDSSSDEDNFIEVSSGVPSPKVEKGQEEKDISANNIDKLLGTKTNSLWMKIVQQKLDDMVHINTLKTSPKKAIMDSRKLETKVVEKHKTSKDNSEILKPVKISLDFEVKPLKMEDNIFSDIFTDLVYQSKSEKTEALVTKEGQGSWQNFEDQDVVNKSMRKNCNYNSHTKMDHVDIDVSAENKFDIGSFSIETPNGKISGVTLPNATGIKKPHSTCTKYQTPLQNGSIVEEKRIGNLTSTSNYWRGSSEEDKVTYDEVEIMSSSDETDDEDDITVSTPQPSTHINSKIGQSSSGTLLEQQSANTKLQIAHSEGSNIQPPKSIVGESEDRSRIETNQMKNVLNKNESADIIDSENSKVAVHKGQKDNIQEAPLISHNSIYQANNITPDSVQHSHAECKNSTDNSHPSDRNSEDGDFMEAESDDGESVDEQEEKEQEESKVPPHSHDNERSPEITKKSKNVSGEDISVTSKKKIKVTMSDDEIGITNENMKQKVALNNSDSSTVAEAKSHQDTDIKEERKANVTDIKEEGKADEEDRKLNGTGIEEERKVNGRDTEEEREANDADIKEEREADVTAEMMGVQVAEFDRPLDYTEDELKHLEGELASEQQALVAQAQRCDRLASSLNDQMYGEAQHLLQLFGIPYLVAPMEAEAQCAFLNTISLTEGTITDDSDIFLFGGNSVYRNFFNQTRHVEHFKIDNIKSTLGLERCKMITLALLCGSDYTEGIEGIGSVGAMEVLAEFPGEGIECLQNVRKWWNGAHKGISTIQHSKIRQKLAQVSLPESFPNKGVFDAYLVPEVDESKEKFSWAVPNVEALRVFTGEKFGWNLSKTDEILIPVMKRLKLRTTQKRIESYFTNIKLVKEPKVASKRMQDAIAKARGIRPPESHSTGQTKVKQKQNERRVRKGPERKQVSEESKADSEVATDSKSSKPSRTLLIDPSEIKSKSVTEGRKGQKRKKDLEEDNNESFVRGKEDDDVPPRKVTKEDMFKSLLEKETICQREKDKLEMQEKKMKAASILLKQNKGKKNKKR
uniref:DNA repair protein complementing XP-G cells n=1 Tax=Scylla olivacea TaxID=85551 RepID=A0A0P4WE50_SCYOL